MSAFLVSSHHIDLLASAALDYRISIKLSNESGLEVAAEYNARAIGRLLWAENIRSLTYRYSLAGSDEERGYLDDLDAYRFHRYAGIRPSAIAAALACYNYQACECPDYDDTLAAFFVSQLKQALGGEPLGYDDEPWGFDSAEQVQAAQAGAA